MDASMRKLLLTVLVLGLVAVAIATRGSIGSGIILAGLLVGFGYTGYRRYLENREDDWYDND